MEQQNAPDNQENIPVKKKKKRGCCFGCLMVMVVLVVIALGTVGYFVYQSLPKKSAVEKEYKQIPDYFEN